MKLFGNVMYSAVIGFGLAAGLAACANPAAAGTRGSAAGSETAAVRSDDLRTEQTGESSRDSQGKVLVVYFSCTNTTKALAEYAAEILDADLYEIVAEEPYTEKDLAYYTGGRADKEQNDPSARPGISGKVENMEGYTTILLGYPIWHGQAPRIISTFLESYDFSGKTILPFCTSHSSGMGSSGENLHSLCPDSVKWLTGKRFEAKTSKTEVGEWLESELGGSVYEG